MATLVTGGAGFIGANTVLELARRGHQIVSLDIEPVNDLVLRNLEPWAERVTWLQGDVLNTELIQRIGSGHDIEHVIHTAAYAPYGSLEKTDWGRVIDINVTGTKNLLELAREVRAERFVYVSSTGVYQGTDPRLQPLAEDLPLRPTSLSGITKYAGESLTRRYGELFDVSTVGVRLAQNWGPMERITPYHTRVSLPYMWARSAIRGEPIEVGPFGTGLAEGRRFNVEHPYVTDTAVCLSLILENPTLEHAVYNISTGRPVPMLEMVKAMKEACPGARFVDPIPEEDASVEERQALDVSRMQEDLGFSPRYDLVAALRDYLAWRTKFDFQD